MIRPVHFFINIPVSTAKAVDPFYKKLGFKLLPPVFDNTSLWTDGKIHLQHTYAENERASLLFFTEQALDELAVELQHADLQVAVHDYKLQLITPSGFAVQFTNKMLSKLPKLRNEPLTICGSFAELSLVVNNLSADYKFWQILGFHKAYDTGVESTWHSLSNGLVQVGLYKKDSCPHVFHSPAITYFEPDSPERIRMVKEKNVFVREEIKDKAGVVSEAVLEDPEGQHLFLFKA